MSEQVDIAVMVTKLAGGIGRNKLNLVRAFCQLGYRVALLVEKPGGTFYEQMPDEVQVFHLSSTHPIAGVLPLTLLLRKLKPRALVPCVIRLTQLAVRARSLSNTPIKIFPVVHNTYSNKDSTLKEKKLEKRRRKVSRYYPQCDGVVCVSQGVKEDIQHYARTNLEHACVIHNPMVTDELYQLKDEPVDHSWLLGEEKVILNAGRFSRAKNLPLLIEAFNELRKQYDAKLLLITTDVEKLQALTETSPYFEDIDVIDFQSNPFKYMAKANQFVLCSDFEGFGNVIVEALACGTPVVSTDCPSGPAEILENGRIGKLVPMRDVKALANAMGEQLNEGLCDDALSTVEHRFRDVHIAQRYLEYFGIARSA